MEVTHFVDEAMPVERSTVYGGLPSGQAGEGVARVPASRWPARIAYHRGMRRLATALAALALPALASCDGSDPPDASEPECVHCCYCLCTDGTIPIDTDDPADCIDCVERCVTWICSRYGGGGGEGSGPCDEPDAG